MLLTKKKDYFSLTHQDGFKISISMETVVIVELIWKSPKSNYFTEIRQLNYNYQIIKFIIIH